jgi:hypothetical protein
MHSSVNIPPSKTIPSYLDIEFPFGVRHDDADTIKYHKYPFYGIEFLPCAIIFSPNTRKIVAQNAHLPLRIYSVHSQSLSRFLGPDNNGNCASAKEGDG